MYVSLPSDAEGIAIVKDTEEVRKWKIFSIHK